jgi:pantoate--beta-alanine ligase
LPQAMKAAIARIEEGQPVPPVLAALEADLLNAGFASVDYAVLADAASLASIERLSGGSARLLVAARIGGTRLIDNMAVG